MSTLAPTSAPIRTLRGIRVITMDEAAIGGNVGGNVIMLISERSTVVAFVKTLLSDADIQKGFVR